MDKEQKENMQFWQYLVGDKTYHHLKAWYNQIKRDEGPKQAEEFKKKVNYIRGEGFL